MSASRGAEVAFLEVGMLQHCRYFQQQLVFDLVLVAETIPWALMIAAGG